MTSRLDAKLNSLARGRWGVGDEEAAGLSGRACMTNGIGAISIDNTQNVNRRVIQSYEIYTSEGISGQAGNNVYSRCCVCVHELRW